MVQMTAFENGLFLSWIPVRFVSRSCLYLGLQGLADRIGFGRKPALSKNFFGGTKENNTLGIDPSTSQTHV
jgi:hypothetical protein